MTLYRVGRNSPIVEALLNAIENGKQVAVMVELKARFDEESNIEWARALEAAGVHVVYGLVGLKVHSKVALVVRREGETIRRYVHLGTGNYNPTTARLYTDLSFFTADEQIGADVTDLFNYVTGYSAKNEFRKLLVAPDQSARRPGGSDPPRNRARIAKASARSIDFQDERARGSRHDSPAVRSVAGRRARRSAGARHLLPAPRSPRRQRKHPRAPASSAVFWNTAASTTSATAAAKRFTWAAPT